MRTLDALMQVFQPNALDLYPNKVATRVFAQAMDEATYQATGKYAVPSTTLSTAVTVIVGKKEFNQSNTLSTDFDHLLYDTITATTTKVEFLLVYDVSTLIKGISRVKVGIEKEYNCTITVEKATDSSYVKVSMQCLTTQRFVVLKIQAA